MIDVASEGRVVPDGAREHVVFRVAGHAYTLPIEATLHVLPLPHVTRIPSDAPHVLGLFHHLGRVMVLWDLHTLFGCPEDPPERPTVLVVTLGDRRFGLLVAGVDSIMLGAAGPPSAIDAVAPHIRPAVVGTLIPMTVEEGASGEPSRGRRAVTGETVRLIDLAALVRIATGEEGREAS